MSLFSKVPFFHLPLAKPLFHHMWSQLSTNRMCTSTFLCRGTSQHSLECQSWGLLVDTSMLCGNNIPNSSDLRVSLHWGQSDPWWGWQERGIKRPERQETRGSPKRLEVCGEMAASGSTAMRRVFSQQTVFPSHCKRAFQNRQDMAAVAGGNHRLLLNNYFCAKVQIISRSA